MEIITSSKNLDLETLSGEIVFWLNEHGWDTIASKTGDNIWKIDAVKEGFFRDFFCTRGKVNVSIFKRGSTIQVQIHDHSFGENWEGNANWAILTGGTNLAFTASGKLGISRLTNYIRSFV